MDFNYININQICSFEGRFASINTNYEYREYKPKKGFFSKEQKKGFYYGNELYSIEQRGDCFVKDKKVFRKPFIIINMSNKDEHRKVFKSNTDMFEFLCKSPLSKLVIIGTKTPLPRRDVLLEKYQGYSDEFRILLKNSLEVSNL